MRIKLQSLARARVFKVLLPVEARLGAQHQSCVLMLVSSE